MKVGVTHGFWEGVRVDFREVLVDRFRFFFFCTCVRDKTHITSGAHVAAGGSNVVAMDLRPETYLTIK